ncbi:MAG TPA: hypothetical protein PKH23_02095, partial [Bacillota bacterium]|nr:hypothetical protein [Bacillota bacterium]
MERVDNSKAIASARQIINRIDFLVIITPPEKHIILCSIERPSEPNRVRCGWSGSNQHSVF